MFFPLHKKTLKNVKSSTKIQVIRSRVCNVGQVQQSESDSESSDQSTVVSTYFMFVNLSEDNDHEMTSAWNYLSMDIM